jgi:RNA polymerase sigma-70 factor (ECF subfamily)
MSAEPFEAIVRAHRGELLVHCYRMLGSWTDAEDVLQDALLRAWRGLARFEGRASTRSWLYRIATNACLDALRRRRRRSLPEMAGPAARAGSSLAPPVEDARWIQPCPSTAHADVEALASSRESVTLAFVLALQFLSVRQRAMLLLQDVVGYEASEVAAMLKTTPTAVHSGLARARDRMARLRRGQREEHEAVPLGAGQRRLLESYLQAWEAGDIDTIVSLLSRDATFSMPPWPTWYRGRAAIARWLEDIALADARVFRYLPTIANGQPAFAVYKKERRERSFKAFGIEVLWPGGRQVVKVVSFCFPRLNTAFGFPERLRVGWSKK